MLWTILVILIIVWLLGFLTHIGGSLIHLILVIALIILVIQLVRGNPLPAAPSNLTATAVSASHQFGLVG